MIRHVTFGYLIFWWALANFVHRIFPSFLKLENVAINDIATKATRRDAIVNVKWLLVVLGSPICRGRIYPRFWTYIFKSHLLPSMRLVLVELRGELMKKEGRRIAVKPKSTDILSFLRERDYVTFGSLLSQFRLSSDCMSSVCNAGAPYSEDWSYRQYFFTTVYAGHPLTSMQNFTEIVLGEPLRRER